MSSDMNSTSLVYLDTLEYERIRFTDLLPESWCTKIEGYWVHIVSSIVYELEYRSLMNAEELMSTYIEWDLTQGQASGKLLA